MHGSYPEFIATNKWMPHDTDKRRVFALLAKAVQYLSIQQLGQVPI